MPVHPANHDRRIAAIAIVGAFTTALLGLCIPLASMTESGVMLPMSVIASWMLSILVIWLTPDRLLTRPVMVSDSEFSALDPSPNPASQINGNHPAPVSSESTTLESPWQQLTPRS